MARVTIPGTGLWNVVAGWLNDMFTELYAVDLGKENSLGNPTANGQVLASQTDGTRSWVTPDTDIGVSGWFDDGVNFRITVVAGVITDISDSSAAGPN